MRGMGMDWERGEIERRGRGGKDKDERERKGLSEMVDND